jgi:hypothetical protein
VARRICSRADQALRDEYALIGWVQRPASRRALYFAWCDRAAQYLSSLRHGADPTDESLVLTLIAGLAEDDSFASHVRRRRGSFLTEDANWDKLYRAAAGTILEEYLDAVEHRRWP